MAGSDEPIGGVGMRPHLQQTFNHESQISRASPISSWTKLTSIYRMVSFRLVVETDRKSRIFSGHRNIFSHTSEVWSYGNYKFARDV